jgi:hypothetical protein
MTFLTRDHTAQTSVWPLKPLGKPKMRASEITVDHLVELLFVTAERPTTAGESQVVDAVLTAGPQLFVRMLGSPELSDAIADLVCQRASRGEATFAVCAEDVRDVVAFFFTAVHGAATVDRIGVDSSQAVQRTLHDCVCGVSRVFQSRHLAGSPPEAWRHELLLALDILFELTKALRDFLPPAPFARAWSEGHVLATCLKTTKCSVVETLSMCTRVYNLPLFVLCDGVLGAVMSEDDVLVGHHLDIDTGFGACARSEPWKRVAAFASNPRFAHLLVHAPSFNAAVRKLDAPSSPLATPPAKRPACSPTDGEKRVARPLCAVPEFRL